MISTERKEFNKAVRELDEISNTFNAKFEETLVAILNTQPRKKISFTKHRPKYIQDCSETITLATISAIWLEEDGLKVKMAWKEDNIAFNETQSFYSADFDNLYPNYASFTDAVKQTLKDKENPQTEPQPSESEPTASKQASPAQNNKPQGGFFSKLLGF
jgi:hypothetical protein